VESILCARPRARTFFGSTCEVSLVLSLGGDRRGYREFETRAFMRTPVPVYHWSGPSDNTQLSTFDCLAKRSGRIAEGLCNRCCTRGWCRVAPDVALCNAADGTNGERKRVFQACIRLCGGIFLGLFSARSPHRFLLPLQFICRWPGLVRATSARLCSITASGFAEHAVDMNYGTGVEMTLCQRRRAEPIHT
jgi:hypothetical protein